MCSGWAGIIRSVRHRAALRLKAFAGRLAGVGEYLARIDSAPTGLTAVGRRLGHGLAGLVNLLNPQLIVLGGFLRPLYRWVEADVRAEMTARALRIPGMAPRIVMPGLGDRSVLIGASEVAFRALLDDPVGCLSAARHPADLSGLGV